jgi:hypothetical protein
MPYICGKLRNSEHGFKKKGPDAQVLLMFMLEHTFDHVNTVGAPNLSATVSVPYRAVPYRSPRGTVLVDRTAYCTFSNVFIA